MKRAVRGMALAFAIGVGNLALGACWGTCGIGGPGSILEPVVSAQYQAAAAGAAGVVFPWLGAEEDAEVKIDRDAGTVVVSYRRDGALVVETWRVTGSR